jgi:hypothetical protein
MVESREIVIAGRGKPALVIYRSPENVNAPATFSHRRCALEIPVKISGEESRIASPPRFPALTRTTMSLRGRDHEEAEPARQEGDETEAETDHAPLAREREAPVQAPFQPMTPRAS